MKNLIIISFALAIFYSCSGPNTHSSRYEEVGRSFLFNIYNRDYKSAYSKMATSTLDSVTKEKLSEGLIKLSDKLREEFQSSIKTTFITEENIFHDSLPAIFLVLKVESFNRFSYYFFYINEKDKTILLVSQFSNIKEKR